MFDTAVMSDNPTYVKTVREKSPKIGGIVEFNELEDIYDAVRITNANLASVAVISQRMATQENVFYLQARFRTVWVRPENSQKPNLYNSINSGAYGIVSEDYESVTKHSENTTIFLLRECLSSSHTVACQIPITKIP